MIDQYHNDDRNYGCQKKGICIPYRHISRQTIAPVIHICTYTLKYGIAKNISDQGTGQRDQNRKRHIMKDQLTPGITGCT